MKQYLRKLFTISWVIWLLIGLVSCQSDTPFEGGGTALPVETASAPTATAEQTPIVQPSKTAQPTQTLTVWPTLDYPAQDFLANLAASGYEPGQLHDGLSPDGKWVAYNIPIGGLMRVISLEDPDKSLEAVLPNLAEHGAEFVGWSPDSTIMVFIQVVGLREYRGYTLYTVSGPERGTWSEYLLPEDQTAAYSVWAPDSELLAINSGKKIHILTRQGEIVRELELNVLETENHQGLIRVPVWSGQGLFVVYQERDDWGWPPVYSELRWYRDVINTNAYEVLLTGGGKDDFLAIDVSPEGNGLLLQRCETPDVKICELWVLDVATQKVTKEIFLFTKISGIAVSIPRSSVAFLQGKPEESVYIFDWQTKSLREYSPVSAFMGWHTNLGGFLVERSTENGFVLDVIRP